MEGHGKSWKVMEGHGTSRKVKEGYGWSFPITRLTFQMRTVTGGWWWVACRIIVSAPVPVPFLMTLDFGFWTWIGDLDFGLGFWTGLGLDNFQGFHKLTIIYKFI